MKPIFYDWRGNCAYDANGAKLELSDCVSSADNTARQFDDIAVIIGISRGGTWLRVRTVNLTTVIVQATRVQKEF